jgi:RNA polymerase sigma factor (sigma-70 family)
MMAKLNGLFRALAPADAPTTSDAELLARFVADRCEAAFAELARRYGPLVLAACRRVCGDAHLAEDAFQAAFVVFAAKASTVKPAAALPAWLHSVATRTALRARTVAHRRSRRETPVEVLPETAAREPSAADGADLARAVDEEIAKLPEALRVAVVLCELQGASRKDAAARMGVPEGTVSSRLAAARKALAERLKSRGLAPSAAVLSAALGAGAQASVPAALAARALAVLAPETLPAAVAALSSGVLRTMLLHKLKLAGLLVALALCVAAGVALAVPPSAPKPDPDAPFLVRAEEPKGAPKALPKGPNKLVYYHNGHIVLANPDGTGATRVADLDTHHLPAGRLAFAPDGSALLVQPTICSAMANPIDTHLVRLNPELGAVTVAKLGKVRKLDKTIYPFSARERAVCWSADGTKVLETAAAEDENGKRTLKQSRTKSRTSPPVQVRRSICPAISGCWTGGRTARSSRSN